MSKFYKLRNFVLLPLLFLLFSTKMTAQDLSVTVTSNQATFSIYNYITFYVDAINNGTTTVNNVRVGLPMPSGAAFDCGFAPQGVWESWTPSGYWTVGTLNAGQTVRLTATIFTLNVANIAMAASIGSTTVGFTDPVATNNSSTRTVTQGASSPRLPCDGAITQGDSVDLELTTTITAPNGEINVGQIAPILVQVRNRSARDATNVSVKNNLPVGMTYQNHFADGTYNGATGNWTIGTIQANATRTLTLNALVAQGGILRDVAEISAADQPDIDSRPNNYNAANGIREDDEGGLNVTGMQVDMELSMALAAGTPSLITVGQNITYILTLRNVGATRGDNVKVRAILPTGLQYVSSTASLGVYDASVGVWVLNTTPDAQGNKPGMTVNANQTITLQLIVRPLQTGTVAFNTEMRVCNMPDIDSTPSNMVAGEDDDATVTINVQQNTDPNAADLQIGMNALRTPTAAGDSVTWSVSITNAGPATATNITLQNNYPTEFNVTNVAPSVGTWNSATKTWSIPSLVNGGFQTITFRGLANCYTTSLRNFAQVMTATQTDPDSPHGDDINQTADQDDEFVLNYNALTCTANNADLALTSSLIRTPILNGDSLVFNIVVSNSGPLAATGVTVKNVIPASLSALIATTTTGSVTGDTWTVGNLANGASATLTFRGVVTLAATARVFAQVQTGSPTDSDSPHGNDTNQTADEDDETALSIAATGSPSADLALTMTATPTAVGVGSNVAFTLTLTNNGPSAATGVTVRDVLPTGLTQGTTSPSIGTFSAGNWTIPTLASGASATLTINASVSAITTTIRNFAQVTASGLPDPDSAPNNNATTTPVEDDEAVAVLSNQSNSQCDLDVVLSCPYATALPIYQNVNFVCTVRNTGGAAASGVRVGLTVPTGLAFSSSSTTRGSYDSWAGVWLVGNVAAGETVTLTINLFTLQTTTSMFAQVVAASPTDVDSSPNNNAAGVNAQEDDESVLRVPNVAPQRRIDMELTHTANVSLVQTNTAVAFTVVIDNKGDTTASGVTVKYPLPVGMTFGSATAQQGNYNATTGIWTVGSMAAAQRLLLTVNATVTATTGGISSFAQVQTATPNNDLDSSPGNNTTNVATEDDEALVEISRQGTGTGCDLELSMVSNLPTYRIYTNTDFTVTLRNTGAVSATNVVVSFPFPANFVFTSQTLSAGTTYDNFRYEWNIGTVAAGATKTMTLTLFSLSAAAPARAFAQVKTASPVDSDSSPGNNTTTTPVEDDEALVVVNPGAGANFEKNATPQYMPVLVRKMYPNPATNDVIAVELNSIMEGEVKFMLNDAMGRTVRTETQLISKGNQQIALDLYDLPDGIYFLQLSTNGLRGAPVKLVKTSY